MPAIKGSSAATGDGVSTRRLVTKQAARLAPVAVPAAELEPGVWLRDLGRLRRVRCVEPVAARGCVRVFFDDDPARESWLCVAVGQMVTVWRGSADG